MNARRLTQRSTWASAVHLPKLAKVPGLAAVRRWLVVTLVGVGLGIFAITIPTLPPKWVPLLILAVLCPFIAMIVGNPRKLLLALILFDVPFNVDINFGYKYDAADLNALGGFSVSVTTIALIGLYILWLSETLIHQRRQPGVKLWTATTVSLTSFLAFTIISMLSARDITLALFQIVLLVQTFLLYIYIIATVRTREDMMFIITILLVGFISESLIIIALRFVGRSIQVAGITARVHDGVRVAGTLGAANSTASYLNILLALSLGVLLTRSSSLLKITAGLAYGLGGVALVLTLSRGGWIAFILSMTIFCIVAWRRGWLATWVPVVAVLAGLLILFAFQDVIAARIFGDDGGSAYSRVPLNQLAFKMIRENPILGVGANNFALAISEYATPEFGGAWLRVVHNRYLLIWAEAGPFALGAYLWFLATIIQRAWQAWKANDRLLSPLALSFVASIPGFMTHMLFDIFNGRPPLQLLWLGAALVVVLSHLATAKSSPNQMSTGGVVGAA